MQYTPDNSSDDWFTYNNSRWVLKLALLDFGFIFEEKLEVKEGA